MTRFLNLLRRLFGIKLVAFPDRKAAQERTKRQMHAQLAREIGYPWKDR